MLPANASGQPSPRSAGRCEHRPRAVPLSADNATATPVVSLVRPCLSGPERRGFQPGLLVTAVVISALGAGGVLPGDEGDWTEVAVIGGGLLLGMLALGGVRAERARRYGCW